MMEQKKQATVSLTLPASTLFGQLLNSLSPTGNTKDKRMSSFMKCITALLGKMLYVDSKAMIAPIAITDDDSSSYISSKADIPTNFTKLGEGSIL